MVFTAICRGIKT